MLDLLSPLVDSVLNPIREAIARLARSAAELAMVGIFGLLCLGFLIAALTIWLSTLVGGLYATLIMAGVFFVLAVIVLAVWLASNAADRKKAEQAAKEKAERSKRQALGGPSMWRTAMSLAPLISIVAKRGQRRPPARAAAERAADRTEAFSDRLAEDARRASVLAADGARSATRASRKALRSTMRSGAGPWAVVAVAVAGGALASRLMRRR